MENVVKVASYICQRYQRQFGKRIDEMKLHKLLYFTQRESIIQTGQPIFEERFEAGDMVRYCSLSDSFTKKTLCMNHCRKRQKHNTSVCLIVCSILTLPKILGV